MHVPECQQLAWCMLSSIFRLTFPQAEAEYGQDDEGEAEERGLTYQSKSTSSSANSLSLLALCLYPPTESRKWETTISDLTTGLEAHSVPR